MADKLHHIQNVAQFDELLSSTTYVVADFFATWCGPCKAIAPTYEKLADKHGIEGQLAFAKVDVDAVQEIAARYSIRAMPTFLFFKEGKRVGVNGDAEIQGAVPPKLLAAAEKLGGLAKARAEAAAATA
ncbi:Thioredoxin-like protein [Cladobotryum mycophilum]|uniref:Thioredoxin-like protein n=1 Tax=Cladobotryum mycophilum TaxID=491253 RepID=A0ABR0SVK7_9HYPO